MVKRLSFLLVWTLINATAFARDNDSPDQGMGERIVAFYRVPFSPVLVIDSSSYELDRINSQLIPDNEYDHIIYVHSLFDNELIDQEELVRGKVAITSAFQAVLATTNLAIKALIPDSANLSPDFRQCFAQLNTLYGYVLNGKFSKNQKFMTENAMQTLALLNGDATINRHTISSVAAYSNFHYPSLPNAKQLFVFGCNLSGVLNPKKFALAYLAENYSDPLKWVEWKKPFEQHFPVILSHDDLGLSMAADRANNERFIRSLAEFLQFGETLPCLPHNSRALRVMSNLFRAYIHHSLEKITPLTEALFMAMRGHNLELFDEKESDKPSCAEGLYLNLMREILAMLNGGEIFMAVEINRCA